MNSPEYCFTENLRFLSTFCSIHCLEIKQNKPYKVRAAAASLLLCRTLFFRGLRKVFQSSLLINQPNQKNQNQQANICSLSCLFVRFGFKIVGQNTENKKDRIHDQLYHIIIRAFIIHTKRFTLQLLLYIFQFLR